MSDFKRWWGEQDLMVSMAEAEEAWDYQGDRIEELEAELAALREGIANARLCDSVVQMDECLAALLEGSSDE